MKILIASSIHADAIAHLEKEHDVICAFRAKKDVLKSHIVDREVLIFRSGVQITAEVMAEAPNLKLLLRAGSGIDNIDLDYVREKGLKLIRIPGPGAKAVAEISFAFMLALARNLLVADQKTRAGVWAKHEMTGYLLTGKTLGIIGAGNIGARTGHLGVSWDMTVLGSVQTYTEEKAQRLAEMNIRLTDTEEVLRESDFVSVHVPLGDATRNLISTEALSLMKPAAYLINLARGGVVDEQALLKALQEERIAGAALDVHAEEGNGKISPLAGFDNVILTPHIGAGTFDSQYEIGQIVIGEIESLAKSN